MPFSSLVSFLSIGDPCLSGYALGHACIPMQLRFLFLRRLGPQGPRETEIRRFDDIDGLLIVLPKVKRLVGFHPVPDDGFYYKAYGAIGIDVALSFGGGYNPLPVLREQVSGGSGFTLRVYIVVPHWAFAAFSSICF